MESTPLLDCAGRRRSPATTSTFHQGLSPRNKGLRYPPDPPTVEEIVAVMRAAGDSPEGVRLRGIMVVLWRAGLRISEALALSETDLDPDRGSVVVRHGKGDKRREVGMDSWAWTQLKPWLGGRDVRRGDLADRHPEQLGHADLAITSRYLRGIDNTEIIAAVHERPAPMIPADPRLPRHH